MGLDWSLLPPELLQATADKITSLADYLRFRAVCHSWRSAASPTPRHLPVQLPWLMLPYPLPNNGSTHLLYDLSSSKIHRLNLPRTPEVDICGSSHGWLFLLHDGPVASLLNPLTRATIPLPPFTASPAMFMPDDGDDQVRGLNENSPDLFAVRRAMLTSSPLDSGCLVFVATYCLLAFCKIGDESWTVIQYANKPSGIDFWDLSYSNGFVYTVDYYANVTVYNINHPSKLLLPRHIGPHDADDVHLVEGMSGDTFLIEYRERTSQYTVYELSNDEPYMIKVTDIGQYVFFLVDRLQAFSFSSANLQFPGWGRNCICHVSKEDLNWAKSCFSYNIKLAKLEDGTVTNITRDLGTFQMCSSWQDSIWLTPSLL